MVLSNDPSHVSFQDEEPIHIPLFSGRQEDIENDSASSSSSVNTALLSDESDQQAEFGSIKLPLPLQLSYVMTGLTLSLPTLPIMYILNSKVAVPLSVLPTYGALSFLPYSFKPFFAYMSSFFPRALILSIGWGTCALTTLAWIWVPSLPLVFFLGIANNFAMAWSSFLLGLTLIDTARAHDSSSHSFEKAGSLFQCEAATARNIGSLLGALLSCMVFGMNHNNQNAFSESGVNGILCSTAVCHLISFLLVISCRDSFAPKVILKEEAEDCEVDLPSVSRQTSYSALDIETASSEEGHEEESPSQSTFCNMNVMIIVGLQALIIVLALKQQIQHSLKQHTMIIPVLVLVFILLSVIVFLRLWSSGFTKIRPETRNYWGARIVGLVLILRHAVPNPTSVLYSFLYHCFQTQPVWLQVFSLVDNGAVTLASWSYQKLWAQRYNQGHKLIAFMMVMTVAAHSTGLLHIAVVHHFNGSHDEVDMVSVQSIFPWLVLAVKAVSTFVSEWNFLPSVVLATVSVSKPSAFTVEDPAAVSDTNGRQEEVDNDSNEQPRETVVKPSLATNVMYGSFVSCIDFGDQIGAMLSTPLVTSLGITRENNWHNLEALILICVGLGVLSAAFLLLLACHIPPSRRHSQLFYFGNASHA